MTYEDEGTTSPAAPNERNRRRQRHTVLSEYRIQFCPLITGLGISNRSQMSVILFSDRPSFG